MNISISPAPTFRPLLRRVATVVVAATLAVTTGLSSQARADDVDIYLNSNVLPRQAPITALALDLPLGTSAVICDNPLTNPPTTDCLKARNLISLGDLASLAGQPVSTITTLVGGLAPTTLLGDLNNSLMGVLDVATNPPPITNQVTFFLAVKQIIEKLLDNRLLIMLSHANTGAARVIDPQVGGVSPSVPCSFADQSSTSDASTPRRITRNCSNGGYVFIGLHNLANPAEVLDVVNRLQAVLVPTLSNLTVPPSFTVPAVGIGPAADSPFQAKEIYLELAKYLRGDPIYNGHLGIFDYGDTNATNNLDTSLPPLSWDPTAERAGGSVYRPVLDEFPDACTVNLISLQLREASQQDDSDPEIATLFPGVDLNGDNSLSLAELVSTANNAGFRYGATDRRRINSYFVVQENLADAEALVGAGATVNTYTDVLGLLERGKDIAGATVKVNAVDASLSSVTTLSDRQSNTGQGLAAYLPVFRPLADTRPNWPGNLKRLQYVVTDARTGAQELRDKRNTPAIDSMDGRIKTSACTVWTNCDPGTRPIGPPAPAAPRAGDGRVADAGGSGQNIPGYVYGGGGNPGQKNATSTAVRKLFYDTRVSGALYNLKPLDADDVAVRGELIAPLGATLVPGSVRFGDDADLQAECRAKCRAECPALPLGVPNVLCQTQCDSVTCAPQAACAFTRSADTIAKELLLHARGYDVGTQASPKPVAKTCAARADPTADTASGGVSGRAWMTGAVLHSRPVAIDYGKRSGSGGVKDVRVVFGSADGYLRMVNDKDGRESWAFMPQSLMRSLKVQRDNEPGAALPYGIDGAPTVIVRDRKGSSTNRSSADFIIDTSTSSVNDRVYIYFGLRRGNNRFDLDAGKEYYAIDATNPDDPRLMWSIGRDGLRRGGVAGVVPGTATQFASLALTFSTPQTGTLLLPPTVGATTRVARSVLFFGGGYNGGRDAAGNRLGKDTVGKVVGTSDFGLVGTTAVNRGNALFVVDAETGALVWSAQRGTAAGYQSTSATFFHPSLEDGIASDVTVLDTDSDGVTDRLYVGDTGGRLWRGDFAGSRAEAWSFIPVASVGRHDAGTTATVADDRRFFHAPDYVPVRTLDGQVAYDIVLFGTGDREKPLNVDTVNWLYALRDLDIVSGKTAAEIAASTTSAGVSRQSAFGDRTTACTGGASSGCEDIATADFSGIGYRIALGRKGEKLTSAPLTRRGVTNFVTYRPTDGLCIPTEGISSLYSIDTRTSEPRTFVNQIATARFTDLKTAGLVGEIMATLAGNAAGTEIFKTIEGKSYRAGWSERVSDEERKVR